MFQISQIIFQNSQGEYLLYLRDDKITIPFPNTWDLIGGHVEKNETPEETLKREVKEEIGFDLVEFNFWKKYVCLEGDISPNIKYIYYGIIDLPLEDIPLYEGQYLKFFDESELTDLNCANVLGRIISDFVQENRRRIKNF